MFIKRFIKTFPYLSRCDTAYLCVSCYISKDTKLFYYFLSEFCDNNIFIDHLHHVFSRRNIQAYKESIDVVRF